MQGKLVSHSSNKHSHTGTPHTQNETSLALFLLSLYGDLLHSHTQLYEKYSSPKAIVRTAVQIYRPARIFCARQSYQKRNFHPQLYYRVKDSTYEGDLC